MEVEIPTLTGLLKRASSEALPDTLRRIRRWIDGIVKPPNAIIVPQMMVGVAGRFPQGQSMYIVHCYVSIFRFLLRTTRRELASEYRPLRGQSEIIGFFIRRIPNGLFGCSSGPRAESTVDSKEVGWQAAILMAATPDALLRTREDHGGDYSACKASPVSDEIDAEKTGFQVGTAS